MAQSTIITRLLPLTPFLLIALICQQVFQHNIAAIGPWIQSAVERGTVDWETGSFSLWNSFWHFKPPDKLWRVVVVAFLPSTLGFDDVSRWQMFSFIADAGVVYAVWIMEANRVASRWTVAYFPGIIAQIFQVIGGGIIAPFYYIGHLLTSPRGSSLTSTSRAIDSTQMRMLLPSMILGYYIPLIGMYFGSSDDIKHWFTWIWQMFPVWVGIFQFFLARVFPVTNKMTSRRNKNNSSDLFYNEVTIIVLTTFSAGIWVHIFFNIPHTISTIFIPTAFTQNEPLLALRTMLQFDHLTFFTAALLWILYLMSDLTSSKLSSDGPVAWAVILSGMTLMVGPGAAIGFGWLVRERKLIRRLEEKEKHGE